MKLRMKQGVLAAVASLFLLVMWAAPTRAQSGPCSNATLRGAYGGTITGQIVGGPLAGPVTGVIMVTYDGQGKFTVMDHLVRNGNLPALDWRPSSGTYTLNADCTGTVVSTFTDGQPPAHASIVVVRRGKEVRTVVDNPGSAITAIFIKRDSPL
jgi:hypothetical protein